MKRQPLDKKWSIFLGVMLIGVAPLLFYTLWRSSAETTLPGDPHHTLSGAVVNQLYEQSNTLENEGNLTHLYVTCTALEGSLCYFMPTEHRATFDFTYSPDFQNATYQIERDLAFQILRELDVKHVERAKNNTLLLHCQRYQDGTLYCIINGGSENWYPVELT